MMALAVNGMAGPQATTWGLSLGIRTALAWMAVLLAVLPQVQEAQPLLVPLPLPLLVVQRQPLVSPAST